MERLEDEQHARSLSELVFRIVWTVLSVLLSLIRPPEMPGITTLFFVPCPVVRSVHPAV